MSRRPLRAVVAATRPFVAALCVALLASAGGAHAGEELPPTTGADAPPTRELRVRVEALTEPRAWSPSLSAAVYPAGADAPVRVQLAPDPARQGFFVGEVDSPAARFLDAELLIDDKTGWRRVVPVPGPDAVVLSLLVEQDPARVTRVAWLPWLGQGTSASSSVSLVVAFGWGAVCALVVGWVARGRPER